MIQKIAKNFFSRQFLKFCIIGGFNTVIDFSIYIFLTRLFGFFEKYFFWANVISFSVAATNSYILNRVWTFKSTSKNLKIQYLKFFLVSVAGVIFNTLILFFLVKSIGLHDLIAKAIAVGVVLFWNFTINKIWTFKNTEIKTNDFPK